VVQPGWVTQQTFLSGYAAAQAVPGPLFTFAAYLGAVVRPAEHPLLNGLLALVAIFLPGLLLIVAVLPYWTRFAAHPLLAPAIRGIHAAVVGVLLAALIHPVGSSTIHSWLDLGLASAAFAALLLRTPPWLLVLIYAAGAIVVRSQLGN
jgi:chromate transporter